MRCASAPNPERLAGARRVLATDALPAGWLRLTAGGLAAFAAGYGETLARGAKGLVAGTSGTPTASATRGNSLTPEFRIDPATGALTTQPGQRAKVLQAFHANVPAVRAEEGLCRHT